MDQRIALSHASGVAAEAILEKLGETGVTPDSLILLDHGTNLGKRLSYAGAYKSSLDQQDFDLSNCSLLLMPEADDELESAALNQGCLLLSHCIQSEAAPVFVSQLSTPPEVGYTQTSLRLAGPELSCLAPVLLELNQMQTIAQLNITLMHSAEFHGRAGIDELASQTVNLLNSRSVEPVVYPQQIAFNLLPEGIDSTLQADIGHILGNNSYSIALQSVNVPIFHGLVAAVQLRFTSDIDLQGCEKRLSALDMVTVENGIVTPISDCNQSFSCLIGHLAQAADQPSNLQFWMITDPMRYGLANNYVNVTDFLLKSFL
ncbi:MAG: hypothetical protein GY896_10050 [Gammaproteobacteria bacterium]|nr:hypothetical protein [Gammaproteobacteria bacterium]